MKIDVGYGPPVQQGEVVDCVPYLGVWATKEDPNGTSFVWDVRSGSGEKAFYTVDDDGRPILNITKDEIFEGR